MVSSVCFRKGGKIMSKVFDCPNCQQHSCVSDTTDLNFCVYCGFPIYDNWRYAYGIHESKPLQAKELSGTTKKTEKIEQISLFNVNEYQKMQTGKGLYC